MRKASISVWGNSLALRIPADIVKELELSAKTSVQMEISEGNLVIKPVKKRRHYTLEELLAGLTPEDFHEEIGVGEEVGAEVID